MNVNNKSKLWMYRIIFTCIGAVVGYVYWFKIGCSSGTCPITSQWHNTMIYGALMGYLVGEIVKDLFFKPKKKNDEQVSEHHK